jgi:hypothetical protein
MHHLHIDSAQLEPEVVIIGLARRRNVCAQVVRQVFVRENRSSVLEKLRVLFCG